MARPLPESRIVSRSAGLVVALIGTSALAGWALDIPAFRSIVPGLVEMVANTACCFVLAGLALVMPRTAGGRPIREGFVAVVVSVASITLVEYVTGWQGGLDEALFKDPTSVAMGLPPGRMALATAAAFVLMGASLALSGRRRLPVAAQTLTFAAMLIPLASILAYLFGERSITLTSPYTSLALNTAIAFVILGIGILGECTGSGPMAVLVSDELGGTSLRRLLPLSLVTTLALVFVAYLGARSGLYSDAAGMIVFAVATSVVTSASVWANGWLLNLAESERRRDREWFQMTLRSIGDAVIATDRDGRVRFLNPIAEALTGWGSEEAAGLPLGQVFRIVGEANREAVESPVAKALREGSIVGLANHTLLIARDGTERPIDDSAAPIRDGRGEVSGVVLVFHDVTEARKVERELAESERRFRLTADNAPVLIWIAGTDKLCTWFNKPWLAFTGRTMEQEYGNGWAEGVHPDDFDRSLAIYASSFDARIPFAMDYRLRHHGGDYRWIFDNGTPLHDTDGAFTGYIGSCVDIQDRVAAEEELRENDRRKDEFLAMLAHELRNPLSAVGGAIGLLNMTDDPDHVGFAKEIISRQMKHLTRLIDDLLDVSRINRGKIELRRDVLEITPILEGAAGTVRALVEQRGHSFAMRVDRGNLWLDVDPTRLEQVVVNLLNNAAKYSEDGGHIDLDARAEGGEVVISVRDRGVGIPAEKLPGMFELFAQGDRSIARSEGGLGIGLTVVKKLVEMHDGRVVAESGGPGRGCEFTIRLPKANAPARADHAPARPTGPVGRGARVLVVDDNVDTVRGMARLLGLVGHEVATAHDGHQALEVAREFMPGFILLDIGLPGLDGYQVASRLRREERSKDAVIVAVSGYGQDEDRRRSKEAGFDHHFIKPIDQDALLRLLSTGEDSRRQA